VAKVVVDDGWLEKEFAPVAPFKLKVGVGTFPVIGAGWLFIRPATKLLMLLLASGVLLAGVPNGLLLGIVASPLPFSKLFKLFMLIPIGTLVIGGEINDGFALLFGSVPLELCRFDNRELMFCAEGIAIFPGAIMLAATLVELRS